MGRRSLNKRPGQAGVRTTAFCKGRPKNRLLEPTPHPHPDASHTPSAQVGWVWILFAER